MPDEQQMLKEEEMQEEMVLLVKDEEEGQEKYEVLKLKIPVDKKEVRVPHPIPNLGSEDQQPSLLPHCDAEVKEVSHLLCQRLCWVTMYRCSLVPMELAA